MADQIAEVGLPLVTIVKTASTPVIMDGIIPLLENTLIHLDGYFSCQKMYL